MKIFNPYKSEIIVGLIDATNSCIHFGHKQPVGTEGVVVSITTPAGKRSCLTFTHGSSLGAPWLALIAPSGQELFVAAFGRGYLVKVDQNPLLVEDDFFDINWVQVLSDKNVILIGDASRVWGITQTGLWCNTEMGDDYVRFVRSKDLWAEIEIFDAPSGQNVSRRIDVTNGSTLI